MAGRRYYRIGPAFWADHPAWDERTRLIALYILTSPHRTMEGLFRMPLAYAAADLGLSSEGFRKGFDQLLRDGFVEYDEAASVCLIVNALKWQGPENGNQIKAAVKAVRDLPKSPLLRRFVTLSETLCPRLAEALAEAFPEGFGNPPTPTPTPTPDPPEPPAGAVADLAAARRARDRADEQAVFDAWVTATGRTPQTQFDDRRRRVVRKALDLCGLAACLSAVRGVGRSEHHMRNPQWTELRVVLRDAAQIENLGALDRPAVSTPSAEQIHNAYRSARSDR